MEKFITQEPSQKKWPKEKIEQASRILADLMIENPPQEELTQQLDELEVEKELQDHVIALALIKAKELRAEIQETRAKEKLKERREKNKLPKNINDLLEKIPKK